ncbi:MAG: hypothetical protein HYS41_07350 [Candidatus Omnitrophica bacterium]|nr:hypothetical protein [Candidatus Omnitrophota bacterium]
MRSPSQNNSTSDLPRRLIALILALALAFSQAAPALALRASQPEDPAALARIQSGLEEGGQKELRGITLRLIDLNRELKKTLEGRDWGEMGRILDRLERTHIPEWIRQDKGIKALLLEAQWYRIAWLTYLQIEKIDELPPGDPLPAAIQRDLQEALTLIPLLLKEENAKLLAEEALAHLRQILIAIVSTFSARRASESSREPLLNDRQMRNHLFDHPEWDLPERSIWVRLAKANLNKLQPLSQEDEEFLGATYRFLAFLTLAVYSFHPETFKSLDPEEIELLHMIWDVIVAYRGGEEIFWEEIPEPARLAKALERALKGHKVPERLSELREKAKEGNLRFLSLLASEGLGLLAEVANQMALPQTRFNLLVASTHWEKPAEGDFSLAPRITDLAQASPSHRFGQYQAESSWVETMHGFLRHYRLFLEDEFFREIMVKKGLRLPSADELEKDFRDRNRQALAAKMEEIQRAVQTLEGLGNSRFAALTSPLVLLMLLHRQVMSSLAPKERPPPDSASAGLEEGNLPPWKDGGELYPGGAERLVPAAFVPVHPASYLPGWDRLGIFASLWNLGSKVPGLFDPALSASGFLHGSLRPELPLRVKQILKEAGLSLEARIGPPDLGWQEPLEPLNIEGGRNLARFGTSVPASLPGEHQLHIVVREKGEEFQVGPAVRIRIYPPNPAQAALFRHLNDKLVLGDLGPEELIKRVGEKRLALTDAFSAFVASECAKVPSSPNPWSLTKVKMGVLPSGDPLWIVWTPPDHRAKSDLSKQRSLPVVAERSKDKPWRFVVDPEASVPGQVAAFLPKETAVTEADQIAFLVEQAWTQRENGMAFGANLGRDSGSPEARRGWISGVPWRHTVDEIPSNEVRWLRNTGGVQLGHLANARTTTFLLEAAGAPAAHDEMIRQVEELLQAIRDRGKEAGIDSFNLWSVSDERGRQRVFIIPRNPTASKNPADWGKPIADQNYWIHAPAGGLSRLLDQGELTKLRIPFDPASPLVAEGTPILNLPIDFLGLHGTLPVAAITTFEDPELPARLEKAFERVGVPLSHPVLQAFIQDTAQQKGVVPVQPADTKAILVKFLQALQEWQKQGVGALDPHLRSLFTDRQLLSALESAKPDQIDWFIQGLSAALEQHLKAEGISSDDSRPTASFPKSAPLRPGLPTVFLLLQPTHDYLIRMEDGRLQVRNRGIGGGPATVAQQMAALGGEVTAAAFLAGEAGRKVADDLKGAGDVRLWMVETRNPAQWEAAESERLREWSEKSVELDLAGSPPKPAPPPVVQALKSQTEELFVAWEKASETLGYLRNPALAIERGIESGPFRQTRVSINGPAGRWISRGPSIPQAEFKRALEAVRDEMQGQKTPGRLIVGERLPEVDGLTPSEVLKELFDLASQAKSSGWSLHIASSQSWPAEVHRKFLGAEPDTYHLSLESLGIILEEKPEELRHRPLETAQLADELRQKSGVGRMLVSLGVGGEILVSPRGRYQAIPSPVFGLSYVTGGRDTVLAVFLSFLKTDSGEAEALLAGVAAEVLLLESFGRRPTLEDIQSNLHRAQVYTLRESPKAEPPPVPVQPPQPSQMKAHRFLVGPVALTPDVVGLTPSLEQILKEKGGAIPYLVQFLWQDQLDTFEKRETGTTLILLGPKPASIEEQKENLRKALEGELGPRGVKLLIRSAKDPELGSKQIEEVVVDSSQTLAQFLMAFAGLEEKDLPGAVQQITLDTIALGGNL